MAATFAPIFLLPEFAFKFAPVAPTLEGQYILKNLVLVSAGWLVFAPHLASLRRQLRGLLRKPSSGADEGHSSPNHSRQIDDEHEKPPPNC